MPETHDFRGRVLQIWLKGPAKGSVAVNVSLGRIGERDFLIGQIADKGDGSDSRAGLPIWFALDEVEMIIEYPNLQAAQKSYAEYKRRAAEKAQRKRNWWQVFGSNR